MCLWPWPTTRSWRTSPSSTQQTWTAGQLSVVWNYSTFQKTGSVLDKPRAVCSPDKIYFVQKLHADDTALKVKFYEYFLVTKNSRGQYHAQRCVVILLKQISKPTQDRVLSPGHSAPHRWYTHHQTNPRTTVWCAIHGYTVEGPVLLGAGAVCAGRHLQLLNGLYVDVNLLAVRRWLYFSPMERHLIPLVRCQTGGMDWVQGNYEMATKIPGPHAQRFLLL